MAKPNARTFKIISPKHAVWKQRALISLILVGALAFTITAIQIQRIFAIKTARSHLAKGWASLATETLEPHRHALSKQKEGCALLLAAYAKSQRSERLSWATEACMSNGIEVPEFAVSAESSLPLRKPSAQ